jgi:hypothetical protein
VSCFLLHGPEAASYLLIRLSGEDANTWSLLQVIKDYLQLSHAFRATADSINNFLSFIAAARGGDDLFDIINCPPGVPPPFLVAGTTPAPKGKGKRPAAAGDDEEGPKKRRSAKKVRDPNEPKRPPSAYLFFQNAVRHQMKETMPDSSYKDLLHEIGQKWKNMADADKKVKLCLGHCRLIFFV